MSTKLHVPEHQRNELVMALVTLVTVILGIALTLTTQAITGAINPPPPLEAPAPDAMQELGGGITHFSNLVTTSLSADTIEVGALEAGALETAALTLDDLAFAGPVLAISGTLSNTNKLAHTAPLTPTYAVCTAHGADPAIITVTSADATDLTLSIITHAGAAANAIPVKCLVIP